MCSPLLPLSVCLYCAQEASDPWQSLDPFDSLDSKPFKKGNWVWLPPLKSLSQFAGAQGSGIGVSPAP